jgi:exodeoxyribonuclease VII large subunit
MMKGLPGKGVNYNGFYYDAIKDETSDASYTHCTRSNTTRFNCRSNDRVYSILSKKTQLNAGRIDLQLNVIELLSQQESKYSEEQLRSFDILQAKAEQGYKDVEGFIKGRIVQQKPITVIILLGKSAIIDSDIKHQLKEAIVFFDFQFMRINLTSETEIIRTLHEYNDSMNILVLVRGGGDNMNIFNKTSLAEEALSLKCFFLTAIGHKEDESLLQKVADKAFITPTALGQYFNEIYNRTIEELQNTKAKLVEDITTQLKVNYEMQLVNLNEKLQGYKEVSEKQLQLANSQLNDLQSQLAKRPAISPIVWLLIVLLAVAAGILVGHFFFVNF